jgi:hypothetical protein
MAYDTCQMPERKPRRRGDWFKLLFVLVLTGAAVLGACAEGSAGLETGRLSGGGLLRACLPA